ncbi:MAG: carbonic anhydrase family protein [Chloroflexota bacterium]|nr:carbonic anhydrase family protein [Chloroflexota bacterium]
MSRRSCFTSAARIACSFRQVLMLPLLPVLGLPGSGKSASSTDEPVDWGYWGAGAPNNWGSLSPDFALCAEGTQQSPIDLVDCVEDATAPELMFDYHGYAREVNHNGTIAHVEYDSGNTLTVGSNRYELVSMHIHVHAEHQVEGQLFPAEMHLVHRKEGGFLGVVGQLYRLGQSDPVVQALIDAYPEPGQAIHTGFTLNAAESLPVDRGYYHYNGSLTTPPCTEGVDWYVLREIRTVSQEQVSRIAALHNGFNHRPIQARNGRRVIRSR